jgi:hypothetical protein
MRIVVELDGPDDVRAFMEIVGWTARLDRIEEIVGLTQQQIDAYAQRVDAAVTGIRADIQALKDANPDVDVTALESKLTALEGLDAENPEATPVTDLDPNAPQG